MTEQPMSMYDKAVKAARERRTASKQRMASNIGEVLSWLDFTNTMSAATPVGSSGGGGGGKKGSGLFSGGQSASSVRNTAEGRGPSSGGIPPMKTWKWRDPVDDQLFRVTTAKGTKKQFKPFLKALAATGYDIDSIGGYNYRNVAGTSRLSEHAYGRAIDLNPGANPMGSRLVTDMPSNVGELAELYNLVWGGNWKSKKDAMHFSTTGY